MLLDCIEDIFTKDFDSLEIVEGSPLSGLPIYKDIVERVNKKDKFFDSKFMRALINASIDRQYIDDVSPENIAKVMLAFAMTEPFTGDTGYEGISAVKYQHFTFVASKIMNNTFKATDTGEAPKSLSSFINNIITKDEIAKDVVHTLTSEQMKVADDIIKYIDSDSDKPFLTVQGKAGVGKTSILNYVVNVLNDRDDYKTSIVTAFTNNAVLQLKKKVVNAFAAITTSKLKQEVYDESEEEMIKKSDNMSIDYASIADVIFVDEVSMLDENDIKEIRELGNFKLVLLGDPGQLPKVGGSPNELPYAFRSEHLKTELYTRIRQGEDSKILPYADQYWNNSQKLADATHNPIDSDMRISNDEMYFAYSMKHVIDTSIGWFREGIDTGNPNNAVIITYTNKARKAANDKIREKLFDNADLFHLNEPLVVKSTTLRTLAVNERLVIKELKGNKKKTIKVGNTSGLDIQYDTLVVSLPDSDKLIELDVIHSNNYTDIAHFKKEIYSEIGLLKGSRNPNDKAKLNQLWLIIKDLNSFTVVDYGYAVTSHSIQGSTITNVIIDEDNIMNVKETTNMDKSQSMYTAITRASDKVIIVSNLNKKVDESKQEVKSDTVINQQSNVDFEENQTGGYPARTKINASADATIHLAINFETPGEKLTKKSVNEQGKTYIALNANSLEVTPERVNKLVDILNSVKSSDNITINKQEQYSKERLNKALGTQNTFMSNFEQLKVPIKDEYGNEYWNSEGYYMAQRTNNLEDKKKIATNSKLGGQASRNARINFVLDQNEDNRLQYMINAVKAKFQNNPELAKQLVDTGNQEIIEKNYWKDDLFGVRTDTNQGANILGKVLMQVRDELQGKYQQGISLNVAGNGIYDMKDYTQEQVDQFTYELLKAVLESPNLKTKITSIRSGGQTGFDEAGAKAGMKLGLPTKILAPKDWEFRTNSGNVKDEQMFKSRFQNYIQESTKQSPSDIYAKLGNKTKSKHVFIKPWDYLKDATEPITDAGIIATRIVNTDKHFDNPYSHDPAGKALGLIKTETVKEAVEKYIDWVINSQDKRAKWIREQIESGSLKNKPILYYNELKEPSHATALDYMIHNWESIINPSQSQSVQQLQSQPQPQLQQLDKIKTLTEIINSTQGNITLEANEDYSEDDIAKAVMQAKPEYRENVILPKSLEKTLNRREIVENKKVFHYNIKTVNRHGSRFFKIKTKGATPNDKIDLSLDYEGQYKTKFVVNTAKKEIKETEALSNMYGGIRKDTKEGEERDVYYSHRVDNSIKNLITRESPRYIEENIKNSDIVIFVKGNNFSDNMLQNIQKTQSTLFKTIGHKTELFVIDAKLLNDEKYYQDKIEELRFMIMNAQVANSRMYVTGSGVPFPENEKFPDKAKYYDEYEKLISRFISDVLDNGVEEEGC